MLILIHGLGGAPAEMQPFTERLGHAGPVITPTLLSHGGRPLAEVGGYNAQWSDLEEQLADAQDAVLIGYSLGGYHALRFARLHPERTRAVVAIGTRVRFDGMAFEYLQHVITPERLFGADEERKSKLEQRFGSELTMEKLKRGLALFEHFRADPPLRNDDLAAIRAPVLLVSGTEDQLAPAAETRRIAALLPSYRTALFPGRGHPIDQVPLERVIAEIKRFLGDVETGRFAPGGEIDLSPRIVTGGTPAGEVLATFRKPRGES